MLTLIAFIAGCLLGVFIMCALHFANSGEEVDE